MMNNLKDALAYLEAEFADILKNNLANDYIVLTETLVKQVLSQAAYRTESVFKEREDCDE